MVSVTAVCLTLNEPMALTLEQSRPAISSRKFEASHISFEAATGGSVTLPDAFLVRLDSGRARHPEGSGLGLAIVQQVASTHGGRIEVEERSGGGAIFRAVLPAA